ncbi:MAG: GNAT family N-acetyltransferase [Microcoleaceae cyanobacterium]
MRKDLPKGCILRRATPQDLRAIRRLIWQAKLDPTQLRWQQFWIIEQGGDVIACGQLRCHGAVQELGSLVVTSRQRHQGLGSYLVQHLIQQSTRPLYLECLGKNLEQYYHRFGFLAVSWQALPSELKLKFGLAQIGRILLKIPIVFMTLSEDMISSQNPA